MNEYIATVLSDQLIQEAGFAHDKRQDIEELLYKLNYAIEQHERYAQNIETLFKSLGGKTGEPLKIGQVEFTGNYIVADYHKKTLEELFDSANLEIKKKVKNVEL